MSRDITPADMRRALDRSVNPNIIAAARIGITAAEHEEWRGALTPDQAFKASVVVYNVLQEKTRDVVSVADFEKVWNAISGAQKLQLAAQSGNATAIVTEAIRQDPVLAAKANLPDATVRADLHTAAESFFDGGGRNPFDRRMSPNGIAGMSSGSSTYLAALSGGTYDPGKGISNLTAANFANSPFASAGLDYNTTRALAALGFNQAQILNAASDAKALGFSPRDRDVVKDFANLDRFDHAGRDDRNAAYKRYDEWQKRNKEEIDRLNAAVDGATDPEAKKAAEAARDAYLKKGQDQTGVTAVGDRLATQPLPPGTTEEDRQKAITSHNNVIRKLNDRSAEHRHEFGNDAARDVSQDTIRAANRADGTVVAQSAIHDAAAKTAKPMDTVETAELGFSAFSIEPDEKPAAAAKADDPNPKPNVAAKPEKSNGESDPAAKEKGKQTADVAAIDPKKPKILTP